MLRKGHILAVLVIFVSLSSLMSIANAEISVYEEHAFYLEYPEEWEIVDTWNAQPKEIFFKTDFRGETGITVSYQKSLVDYSNLDTALADSLAEAEKQACRLNRDGDCWSFVLLDSKIIIISGQKAISIKYSSFLRDQDTITRMVILPDGSNNWLVLGKSAGSGLQWEEDIEKAISSFSLTLLEPTIEPIEESSSFSIFRTPLDPGIELEKKLNVNLILIGDEWSSAQKNKIRSSLPSYYDPIYVTTEDKVGIRYNYNFNFFSEDSDELTKFMDTISNQNIIWGEDVSNLPIWQTYWIAVNHPEWILLDTYGNIVGYDIEYRDVNALAMEEYLYETFVGSNPSLTKQNSVNLVFLKSDLDDINYLRNYYVKDFDKSTNKDHTYYGLMGYGGNYNMFYFDLYAAPWIDFDRQTFDYVEPEWIDTLHDCATDQCFRDLVIFHAQSALSHIITQSLLYPVENFEKYYVDVVVYDIPGGTSFSPQQLKNYVNEALLIEEFENLFPYTQWEIAFSVENRETRGISLDFKDELKPKTPIVYSSDFGEERTVSLLHSTRIQPHLLDWAQSRIEEANVNTETTWHIPVLVVIDDVMTSDLFLDDFGVIGFAPGRNDDETIPCCAFVVTNEKKVGENKVGITDLVLHEVGHVIGLNHPFFSWDEFGDAYRNNYFNWYSSPMTYSFPPYSCGNFFYFVYTDTCGNPNLSFTDFEKNRIADARMVSLLKKINQSLEKIPENEMAELIKQKNSIKQKFNSGDIFSAKGALPIAIEAYSSSKKMLSSQFDASSSIAPQVTPEKRLVPDWVQTTAKFWVDGAVSDAEFTNGIGYLVKQNIIQVEVEPGSETESGERESEIPSWIAQTTQWWIEGQVPEDQFLEGIKWMIKNKIIKGVQ